MLCTKRPVKPLRITPAWAGKSPADEADGDLSEDHPRVGGEKLFTRAKMRGM